MKIILTDTFNNRQISTHRTIEAAVKAQAKHLRAVRRANGENSYLTYSIDAEDGSDIRREVEIAEEALYQGRI
jgi:hypothetical protein